MFYISLFIFHVLNMYESRKTLLVSEDFVGRLSWNDVLKVFWNSLEVVAA